MKIILKLKRQKGKESNVDQVADVEESIFQMKTSLESTDLDYFSNEPKDKETKG
jgi:hypothetical protein